MRLYCLILLLFLTAGSRAQPLGSWREHLPYNRFIDLSTDAEALWAATPYSLVRIDRSTGETERLSRVTGLTGSRIAAIGGDPSRRGLLVAYTDGNIDGITPGGTVRNIPGLVRYTGGGDKTIHSVRVDGSTGYVATGLGLLLIDMDRAEITATWFIATGGTTAPVLATAMDATHLYAATAEGVKRLPGSGANGADFRSWSNISGSGGLPAGPARSVAYTGSALLALVGDTVYIAQAPTLQWTALSGDIRALRGYGGGAALLGPGGLVRFLPASGSLGAPLQAAGPADAVLLGGTPWVADSTAGLLRFPGTTAERIDLPAPRTALPSALTSGGGTVWAAGRGDTAEAYRFTEGSWSSVTLPFPAQALAYDGATGALWAGGHSGTARTGTDPLILPYPASALHTDGEGDLWIAPARPGDPLRLRTAEGTLFAFPVPDAGALGAITSDGAGGQWIIAPGRGLYVFSEGGTPGDPSDDQWRLYRSGSTRGNLPSDRVLSVAVDRQGIVWVGTDRGIGLIQCPEAAFTSCPAVLPVALGGGFAGYLFSAEEVRDIEVDGADRKWIATGSGVWLLSPDGAAAVSRFSERSSPLPSDDVRAITIEGRTGEVFFATAAGMVSYKGSATDPRESGGTVLVYPNPVPPDYTGSIAIRGLPEGALFKIIDPGGRLVYEGRALGGQALWNGRDGRNRRAASGVYTVVATGTSGSRNAVLARILFISP